MINSRGEYTKEVYKIDAAQWSELVKKKVIEQRTMVSKLKRSLKMAVGIKVGDLTKNETTALKELEKNTTLTKGSVRSALTTARKGQQTNTNNNNNSQNQALVQKNNNKKTGPTYQKVDKNNANNNGVVRPHEGRGKNNNYMI